MHAPLLVVKLKQAHTWRRYGLSTTKCQLDHLKPGLRALEGSVSKWVRKDALERASGWVHLHDGQGATWAQDPMSLPDLGVEWVQCRMGTCSVDWWVQYLTVVQRREADAGRGRICSSGKTINQDHYHGLCR